MRHTPIHTVDKTVEQVRSSGTEGRVSNLQGPPPPLQKPQAPKRVVKILSLLAFALAFYLAYEAVRYIRTPSPHDALVSAMDKIDRLFQENYMNRQLFAMFELMI